MSDYILKRNLIREDGEVIKVGEPLPSDIDDEVIKIYIEKGRDIDRHHTMFG